LIREEAGRRVKIVVLVKYVHVPETPEDPPFAADLTVDRTGLRGRLNEADEYAVEQARRIACRRLDVQISALTMGPAGAVAALRRALVLGADQGAHVLDDALHGSDALATSRVLAAAVRRLGFDLVLCGASSADSGMAVVPTMVAERLGVPSLCFADAVRVGVDAADEVVVRRDAGAVVEEAAAFLPALVSVTDRCAAPRYPSIHAVAEAPHKLVRTWSLADLGVSRSQVGLRAAATVTRTVVPCARRHAGDVIRDDGRGQAATALADFLAERHLI
jgi:electron transfer flavoprotein beta subunit